MVVNWDYPDPHVLTLGVMAEDIDELDHVNNAVYVRWLTDCAWSHSCALGMDIAAYRRLDRAMAISRHEIDYLASARLPDKVAVATWITEFDGRLTMARRFQVKRVDDQLTMLRARTVFACIELTSGRPRRMPNAFIDAYGAAVISVPA